MKNSIVYLVTQAGYKTKQYAKFSTIIYLALFFSLRWLQNPSLYRPLQAVGAFIFILHTAIIQITQMVFVQELERSPESGTTPSEWRKKILPWQIVEELYVHWGYAYEDALSYAMHGAINIPEIRALYEVWRDEYERRGFVSVPPGELESTGGDVAKFASRRQRQMLSVG